MSETTIYYEQLKDQRTLVGINELFEWKDNPRTITEKDFDLLRKDLKTQFKPLLVTPNEDGTLVVLGGNMRLKAMKMNGSTKVWVSVVDFKNVDGIWLAYVNGELDKEFKTKEDGMLHYALKDNESKGVYDELKLQEISYASGLDLEEYKMDAFKDLNELVKESSPPEQEIKEKKVKTSKCPACGEVYEI